MLNYTWLYRMVWIAGRFGGGKTALAVYICMWLCEKGYARYIASNVKLGFGTVVRTVSASDLRYHDCNGFAFRDTVILMDESWQVLGKGASRKQVIEWLAFMRKANNFLIMPSVLPLVAEVNVLKVERIFNGLALGIPVWLYRWNLGDYRRGGDRGHYLLRNPSQVFGLYDTAQIPSEDFTIYDTWRQEAEDNRFESGSQSIVVASSVDGDSLPSDSLGGVRDPVYSSGVL